MNAMPTSDPASSTTAIMSQPSDVSATKASKSAMQKVLDWVERVGNSVAHSGVAGARQYQMLGLPAR